MAKGDNFQLFWGKTLPFSFREGKAAAFFHASEAPRELRHKNLQRLTPRVQVTRINGLFFGGWSGSGGCCSENFVLLYFVGFSKNNRMMMMMMMTTSW